MPVVERIDAVSNIASSMVQTTDEEATERAINERMFANLLSAERIERIETLNTERSDRSAADMDLLLESMRQDEIIGEKINYAI